MTRGHSHWIFVALIGSTGLALACRSSQSDGAAGKAGTHDTSAPERAEQAAAIGVAECDAYVTVVGRCIAEHAPADKQKVLRDNLTRMQASWTARASNPGTRPSLGQLCDRALQTAQATMQPFSCEW